VVRVRVVVERAIKRILFMYLAESAKDKFLQLNFSDYWPYYLSFCQLLFTEYLEDIG
jgi:hypothetical protein